MKRLFSKKVAMILLFSMMACMLFGCGAKKIVHCDNCGVEIEVAEDSNVDEDWTLYCKDCEKELGLDKIVE